MKKIFLIIAACLTFLIISLLIVTNFIFINEKITSRMPDSINIYNKSVASLNSKSYKNEDEEYHVVLQKIEKAGKTSLFERLINGLNFENNIRQAEENEYSTVVADVKTSNICIELIFDKKQDKIVYFENNTKVITYNKLLYVFDQKDGVNRILVYYEDGTNGYSNHKPLIINGKTKDMINFVNSISK